MRKDFGYKVLLRPKYVDWFHCQNKPSRKPPANLLRKGEGRGVSGGRGEGVVLVLWGLPVVSATFGHAPSPAVKDSPAPADGTQLYLVVVNILKFGTMRLVT